MPLMPDTGVLIVDDHRLFAESLQRVLDDEPGISVVGTAASGLEGIAMAMRLRPEVALVDFSMPALDGVTTAAEMRRGDPSIKVLMLSGVADEQVILAAVKAGCSGYLTKDQPATDVADAIRSAAGEREPRIAPVLLARLLSGLDGPRSARYHLSEREREILTLLVRGRSNKAIAAELHLSVNTIRNYVQATLNKLGAHSKLEAVAIGLREGIIAAPPGFPATPAGPAWTG
jgi:DNA-binding NarL/FixJ family response regulator